MVVYSGLYSLVSRYSHTLLQVGKASVLPVLSLATTLVVYIELASAAPSLPPGKLVDAAVIEGDSSLICASYVHKKKVGTYLSRIDTKKFLGKSYWTSKEMKARIVLLNKEIQELKGQKGKANKKKLKKLNEEKQTLSTARKALIDCKPGSEESRTALVGYPHIDQIVEKNCMNCHATLGWGGNSEISLQEYLISSGRVVPGNLEASPFYTFTSNNPQGYQPAYMPKGLPPLSDLHVWLLGQWILDLARSRDPGANPTPTPDGPEGQGRQEYNNLCSSCHGMVDVSAKWGKTTEQIQEAINSVPQMLHLKNMPLDQIQRIALALSKVQPPLEGTVSVRNISSVVEGNSGSAQSIQFEVKFTGTASQAFTVGYVTSSGSALAGSDFQFTSGTLQFQGTNGEAKIVSIPVLGDTFQESDETMYLDIGGISFGGVRVNTSTAAGSILNDDTLIQVAPPQSPKLRIAYGFNSTFQDALGLSDATAFGNASITSAARTGGGALNLDGTGDYLTVPNNNLQGLTNITFASWVYWATPTSTSARILDFGSSTTNYIYLAPRDAANRIKFEIRGPNNALFTLQSAANYPLPTDQWVHLAASFNSTTDEMKLFVNGSEIASRTGVTVDLSTILLSDNRIGRSRITGSADLQGRIDELLIWDAALTQAEVAAAMAMTQTTSISSGLSVSRSNGQPVANGGAVDFGSMTTGNDETLSLFVMNTGPAGLAFTNTPNISIVGEDANEFTVQVQPMPWQQMLGVNSLTSIAVRHSPLLPGAKSATLIVSNSDFLNGNYALRLVASVTGAAITPPQPPPGQGEPTLEQGQSEYAINCASCHGPLSSSQKRGTTAALVTAAQHPTTGVLQMRTLGLSSAQISRIVLALNTPTGDTEEAPVVGDSMITVGTAPYVVETLKDIFLPPGDVASYTAPNLAVWTIITEGIFGVRTNGTFIANRVGSFHRRCQRFDTSCQAEQLTNSLRPGPDTIRAGLYKRTCDLLTDNDTAVSNALGKIGLTVNSPLTPQAVRDMYEKLFAPGRALPQYIADVVSTFPNQVSTLNNTDRFRFVLNYMCVSGVSEVQ